MTQIRFITPFFYFYCAEKNFFFWISMNISPFIIALWVFCCVVLLTPPILDDSGDFSARSYTCGVMRAENEPKK